MSPMGNSHARTNGRASPKLDINTPDFHKRSRMDSYHKNAAIGSYQQNGSY